MRQIDRRLPFRLPPVPQGQCVPVNLNQRREPANAFNYCLWQEQAVWERIRACGGLEKICCPQKYPTAPWLKMPATGKRLQRIWSIALPAANGVDTLVGNYQVPLGWDGVIQAAINFYTGLGFIEGSGDLIWRLRINQRYAKDYGNVNVTLGSLQTPTAVIQGPIRLVSGQVVSYWVQNALGSPLAGGRIVTAVLGWTFPR